MDKKTDRCTDEQNRPINGRTHGWTDELTEKWTDRGNVK
jgi:hypothetical protein